MAKLPESTDPDMDEQLPINEKSGRKLLVTGALIAGSALFGGLAVALWNRRTLAQMRREIPEVEADPLVDKDEIY
jgi:hypothetical protein